MSPLFRRDSIPALALRRVRRSRSSLRPLPTLSSVPSTQLVQNRRPPEWPPSFLLVISPCRSSLLTQKNFAGADIFHGVRHLTPLWSRVRRLGKCRTPTVPCSIWHETVKQ